MKYGKVPKSKKRKRGFEEEEEEKEEAITWRGVPTANSKQTNNEMQESFILHVEVK